jgi:hypothetical protein
MMRATQDGAMLDVDDPESFRADLQKLLDAPGVWDELQSDVKGDCKLFHAFADKPECATAPLVRTLYADAERIIRSEYASVAAYHSCCPLDLRSYTKRGLLVTTRELLLELTHEAFGVSPAVDKAFASACHEYLKWYDDTVGLWLTAYETNGHHKGHFLNKMADNLGEEGRRLLGLYRKRCIPSILKCRLPLDWLDQKMREPSVRHYASATLQRMIIVRVTPDDSTCDFGALGLKCNVLPEMIIGFTSPYSN